MTKQELINKLEQVIGEIPIIEWAKARAIEFINKRQREEPDAELQVNYEIIQGRTAWSIPTPKDTVKQALSRLEDLPIFEKYFLFMYTLYEQFLADNSAKDKDKSNVDLLHYRIVRNILVHNNKIVKKDNVKEFDELAKKYDPSLTEQDLKRKFNYKEGAELSILEFGPDLLTNFKKILQEVLK